MIGQIFLAIGILIIAIVGSNSMPYHQKIHSNYIAMPTWIHATINYCDTPIIKWCSFIPLQYARANRSRIKLIQYVGADIYTDYYPESYNRLQDITTLAQYREYPYIFGQYILPYKTGDDDITGVQEALSILWKWWEMFCDMDIVYEVWELSEEDYLSLYYNNTQYIIPCESYLIPQSLAFVSFYYAKDIQAAIMYYRAAALSPDAPKNLIDMPAIIVARYDDDRKSMLLWKQRFLAASDQINMLWEDQDNLFLLSVMEHAIHKAVHHAFVSLIQETAEQYACHQSIECIWQHIALVAHNYLSYCDNKDQVLASICYLLVYARDQWRWDGNHSLIYPLDPQAMVYGWRPDLDKWDIVSR